MNYYNEIDPYCAAWLQNLMDAGHIAQGDIDTRSIEDVRPSDLAGYVQCHFFAGLGGWAYALDLAGWPRDRPAWTGSCPCQPFSVAGKGAGDTDQRHLWPAWHHLISQCRPAVIFGEQVAAAVRHQWLDGVCADLEGQIYAVGSSVLPACSVDSPHKRDRLWFVADTIGTGLAQRERERERGVLPVVGFQSKGKDLADDARSLGNAKSIGCNGRRGSNTKGYRQAAVSGANSSALSDVANSNELGAGEKREQRSGQLGGTSGNPWARHSWVVGHDGKARRVEPSIRLLAHGIPGRVGKLRALGNTFVPQVAAEFVTSYMDVQQLREVEDA